MERMQPHSQASGSEEFRPKPRERVALTRPNFESNRPPPVVAHPDKSEGSGSGIVMLSQTHDHAQWRSIAEEFSILLQEPWVDVVFKVRGGSGLLAAHRTLVAAAWPPLREELKGLDSRPARDLRSLGLAWIDGYPTELDSPSIPDAGQLTTTTSPPVTGRSTPVQMSPANTDSSPQASGSVDRCISGDPARPRSPDVPMSVEKLPGLVDVSSRPWGCYSVMRALLCHLYSRPVEIREREVPQLRAAAQAFGVTELVKSIDDVERRPGPISRVLSQQYKTTNTEPAQEPAGHASGSGQFSATASTAPSYMEGRAGSRVPSSDVASASCLSLQEASANAATAEEVGGKSEAAGPVRVASRPPPAKDLQERTAKAAMTGANTQQREDPQQGEKGCVRRVLSEIKRNIVESSRIIADKTFHQMYEMVPGERGILGEGINGPVRMARHRKTNREVAVKRIQCVNLSEQRRQMLVSEIRIFLQVSHRNIVQLLEVYESEVDQAVLLVMELCTGRELFERLAERRWYSEFDAARVTRQMVDAVCYLHSQNICHRDLKLENWLYENPSQEAKLKLCDFGFGQIVEPSVQLTVTLGSLFYLAPEVLEGSYGLPCDMWSIGVIVYMLIAGVPPFDGKTDADVMNKIRQGRFVSTGKRWEGISETAKHFVRSLLRKDPYERLTAKEAAQHAWLKMESQPKVYSANSWPKGSPDAELELPIDRGVIRDMIKFAQNNAITRAAFGILAKCCTAPFGGREENVLALEQRFRSLDEQGTGKLEAEVFTRVLRETMPMASAEEKQFFDRLAGAIAVPEEGDGEMQHKQRRREVNYNDFLYITKARRMANDTALIREVFRTFDESGDGFIKEDAMHNILGDEFKATIEDYVDENGKEGIIDYNEFANIVTKEMAKKEEEESDKGGREASNAPSLERRNSVASDRSAPLANTAPSEGAASNVEANGGSPCGFPSERQTLDTENGACHEASTSASGGDRSSSNKEPRSPSPRDKADKEGDEEEEYDADAQSDEEQLVNVKNTPSEVDAGRRPDGVRAARGREDAEGSSKENEQQEKKKVVEQKKPEKKPDSRFQSFSLSLAGSSEYDDTPWGVNRVMSMPSDVYSIRQLPGFHSRILRPFYADRPVSNIVMGLIRGTSLYAKQAVVAKLATIIHTTWGWFFIMPNPKYHSYVDTRKGLLSKETGKFRFVAWWIHPRFVPQLRQWFEKLTYEGDQDRTNERREARRLRESKEKESKEKEVKDKESACERRGDDVRDTRRERERGAAEKREESCVTTDAKSPRSADTSVALSADVGDPDKSQSEAKAAQQDKSEKIFQEGRGGGAGGAGATASCEAMPLGTEKRTEAEIGNPGDFRFSDVPKPENYLHTYRDMYSKEHVSMLQQAYEGTNRFLKSLFDETFLARATISMGFHYPVRTQYATLHMQVRVNSGSVCRDDGRGIEVTTLIDNMKRDRTAYERDEQTLRYHVTENIKVSLLAAAQEYEEHHQTEPVFRQINPLSFELGQAAMPTIQDDEEDDEAAAENSKKAEMERAISPPVSHSRSKAEVDSYLINLQPTPGSEFYKFIYEQRQQVQQGYGSDPTYLYPFHVSVSGFFEAGKEDIGVLVDMMMEDLSTELAVSARVKVGCVVCTKTGYVLYDMNAPAIASFAQRLGERAQRELGLNVRPKAVNHISLASDRRDEATREAIKVLYDTGNSEEGERRKQICSEAAFDLVLSRLVKRASFDTYEKEGPHQFAEVARLPVRQDLDVRGATKLSPDVTDLPPTVPLETDSQGNPDGGPATGAASP